jgi:putative radical SAM enzyme (TIGR03279 family)
VYVMMKKAHIIKEIESGSIAEELELMPGDELISVNGSVILDVLDYQFLINDENLTVLIKKQDGEEWELDIEKEYDEDLGIIFEEGLMDEYRSCKNKCIFCFIDQMPPGMRETLYFKDDDARLSFLQGNYITLTNLSEAEVDRIIFYKLAPINISVHTTNEELRCKMLNNRFAGDALKKLQKLKDAGITMNGQIVLCKGWNDGEELEKTMHDLSAYLPEMSSVSVVPVGLTKFRDKLKELEEFTKEDSLTVLEQIHRWQNIFLTHYGTRFIYASDEWYLKADLPIPTEEAYEGYPQLENGVGLIRSLQNEFEDYYNEISGDLRIRNVSIATGILAEPVIRRLSEQIVNKFPNIKIQVYPVINHFFGEQITVAGLLTGSDITEQLKGKDIGENLLLPEVLLKDGETVLLDDVTVSDMENALQTHIRIVQSDGKSFIDSIIV